MSETATGSDPVRFPVELRTERLVLREFTDTDLSGVHTIVGDDRVTVWLSFDSRSREQAQAMLAGILARQRLVPRTEYYLAIATRETPGIVIGFVRLGLMGVKAGDLGYALHPDVQGRGYAREGVVAMLDFAFGALDLHRVVANIGPDNRASLRVVRGLGFTHEGTIRDHVFTNGGWRDSESFSLLAHEYSTFRGGELDGSAPGAE